MPVEHLSILLLRRLDKSGKSLKEINDGATEELYLLNPTAVPMTVRFAAEFWQTADEETGAVLKHGPKRTSVTLAPGEIRQVGDIIGWEWDSVLEAELTVEHGDRSETHLSFDLKENWTKVTVEGLGEVFRIEPVRTLTLRSAPSTQPYWAAVLTRRSALGLAMALAVIQIAGVGYVLGWAVGAFPVGELFVHWPAEVTSLISDGPFLYTLATLVAVARRRLNLATLDRPALLVGMAILASTLVGWGTEPDGWSVRDTTSLTLLAASLVALLMFGRRLRTQASGRDRDLARLGTVYFWTAATGLSVVLLPVAIICSAVAAFLMVRLFLTEMASIGEDESQLARLLESLIAHLAQTNSFHQSFFGSVEWESRGVTATLADRPWTRDGGLRRLLGISRKAGCKGTWSVRRSGEVDDMGYDNTESSPFAATLLVGRRLHGVHPTGGKFFSGVGSGGRIVWSEAREKFAAQPFEIPSSLMSTVKDGDRVTFNVILNDGGHR